MKISPAISLGVLILGASAQAQTPPAPQQRPATTTPGASPSAASPDPNGVRPIDGRDTVFMEDMTWMEIRDAMRAGKDTVILATGGLEQNGPYLVSAKHNIVLKGTTEVIARKLGNALVSSIVQFVPEGDIEPPTGHMKYPGTISLSESTFQALLTDIASSLKTNGFKTILLIGDSGGNQRGMKAVAEALTAKWKAAGAATRIYFVPEYYEYPAVQKWLEEKHGIKQVDEGLHDDYAISSLMAMVDPSAIRIKERMAKGKATINGVALDPIEKTQKMARLIAEYRADRTIEALKAQMAATK